MNLTLVTIFWALQRLASIHCCACCRTILKSLITIRTMPKGLAQTTGSRLWLAKQPTTECRTCAMCAKRLTAGLLSDALRS